MRQSTGESTVISYKLLTEHLEHPELTAVGRDRPDQSQRPAVIALRRSCLAQSHAGLKLGYKKLQLGPVVGVTRCHLQRVQAACPSCWPEMGSRACHPTHPDRLQHRAWMTGLRPCAVCGRVLVHGICGTHVSQSLARCVSVLAHSRPQSQTDCPGWFGSQFGLHLQEECQPNLPCLRLQTRP